MSHPDEELLFAHALDPEDVPLPQETRDHLGSCAACRQRLEALRAEQAALEAALPADLPLPPGLLARVTAAISEESPRARPPAPRPVADQPRRSHPMRWLSVAAALLIAAGCTYWFTTRPPAESGPPVAEAPDGEETAEEEPEALASPGDSPVADPAPEIAGGPAPVLDHRNAPTPAEPMPPATGAPPPLSPALPGERLDATVLRLEATGREAGRGRRAAVPVAEVEGRPVGTFDGEALTGEAYDRIEDNPFLSPLDQPLSTFSSDVDRASYANVRRFIESGQLPPPDAVRIEELLNYFPYQQAGPSPEAEHPVAIGVETASCPWQEGHRLVRISLKGKEMELDQRPGSNLVFLIDVSGSMNRANKLPLLKKAMHLLSNKLEERDQVAIVVYAGAAGLVLEPTPGTDKEALHAALDGLAAGGSTNGGQGIELAYRVAQEHFIEGGINRVILCTDGDFNVGNTSQGGLSRLIEEKAQSGVFLTLLGFGGGNLNDALLETLSNKGNGNYAYIDSFKEAAKVFSNELLGTLWTIAKDVKLQVEFNPARVGAYRLIGYENRILAAQDFNDDTKDAGDMGVGHTVCALYQIAPPGVELPVAGAEVDPLRYQARPSVDPANPELLTVKMRYKHPEDSTSQLLQVPLVDGGAHFDEASTDFVFSAAVAAFGMLLRDSEHRGSATFATVIELAGDGLRFDPDGSRAGFLSLAHQAKSLAEAAEPRD